MKRQTPSSRIKNMFLFGSLLLSLFFICACSSNKTLTEKTVLAARKGNVIQLKQGRFLITETINLPDGVVLKGNNTTLIFKKDGPFPLFKISGNGVKLENFTLTSNKLTNEHSKEELEKYNFQTLINVHYAKNITIKDCMFSNAYGTGIHISDSENVAIINSIFKNFGAATPGGNVTYSYDAVFIGGYKKSSNITVKRCTFENVGSLFPMGNKPSANDGDGIHIQGVGETNYIYIYNNKFIKCAARGIKVQTGQHLTIKHNSFLDCWAGLNFAVAREVDKIVIESNNFTNCPMALSSDCYQADIFVTGLVASDNRVDGCHYFYRTGGRSSLRNSKLTNNHIKNVESIAFEGRFINTEISGNHIEQYALSNHYSYNMAIYISPESDNLTIKNNFFEKSPYSKGEITNTSKNKIYMSNNTFKESPLKE